MSSDIDTAALLTKICYYLYFKRGKAWNWLETKNWIAEKGLNWNELLCFSGITLIDPISSLQPCWLFPIYVGSISVCCVSLTEMCLLLQAYGHYQEASFHLRHCLELKPNFGPAVATLRDMESLPTSPVHIYTVLIIVFLVLGVLMGVLSTLEGMQPVFEEQLVFLNSSVS